MSFDELVTQIALVAAKYETDYGVKPFDVCLGPAEFQLLWETTQAGSAAPRPVPRWDEQLAPLFFKGMRLRRMSSGGVLVGTLSSKTGREPKIIFDRKAA